jgi:error-prone DNA polymerase
MPASLVVEPASSLPPTPLPAYAELHCLSCFSFQRGASQPEELVQRAHALGYSALAITDECSMAGVVRAHKALKVLREEAEKQKETLGLKLLLGAEFLVQDSAPREGLRLVALAHNLQGWGNLCAFISEARREERIKKGDYHVSWQDSAMHTLRHCELLLAPPRTMALESLVGLCRRAKSLWGDHAWLLVELSLRMDDALWLHKLQQASALSGLPLVAGGNVHMHDRRRKPLQDVMTAIRLGRPVAECGFELQASGEAYLRKREDIAALYLPELLEATQVVAGRCTFSLKELQYQYPLETVPDGLTPAAALRRYTYEGAALRYPQGLPDKVREQIEKELALIAKKRYEMYFLTVHDVVRFARSINILCQGRGSAANSAVCYCLHVTAVDPNCVGLLFERFLSMNRDEPPDIDVDFEHERREEVIQYIYGKYGYNRAAIAATVISYQPRSAIRDVGKALGVDAATVDRFAKEHHWFDGGSGVEECLRLAGLDEHDPRMRQWLALTKRLLGFPRHLSQHVGGFVLTQGPLIRMVPVEKAAMDKRFIIQWEKDDLEAVGLMKVDVLALGMLSAIRRCLQMVGGLQGRTLDMADIAQGDQPTYDMICQADTIGVFQIESRAQMSMLPRLKPRNYYDLVVEVAIVRPGPIQGGMVHPYLKNRKQYVTPDKVKTDYPKLDEVLRRTFGVPIFQEQVMQIAMAAADFTPAEADGLRRAMAAWKRKGGLDKYQDMLVGRMENNGYPRDFAERLYSQIQGFGDYGFPESHAASFALLVYVSCWLKWHYPDCFLAAMLNSQPLGFYPPPQLVQDARRHGVAVRAVDVMVSGWDSHLEPLDTPESFSGFSAAPMQGVQPLPDPHKPAERVLNEDDEQNKETWYVRQEPRLAVRLGLRLVSGLGQEAAERLVAARAQAPFTSVEDLALRAALDQGDLKALAAADALRALAGHRRQQVWDASALKPAPALLKAVPVGEPTLALPAAPEGEEVLFDYAALGLTLRQHPLALLRPKLAAWRLQTAAELRDLPSGREVRACGIVTVRQRPGTAKGVVFVTLEDETGSVNVIVWQAVRDKQRAQLLHSRLLAVYGEWQRDDENDGQVRHLIAKHLQDLTPMLGRLATASRDFH